MPIEHLDAITNAFAVAVLATCQLDLDITQGS
jgi:hypothetical protein